MLSDRCRRDHDQYPGAFTLVELVVAITVGSMVLITMAGLFQSSTVGHMAATDRSDLEASGTQVIQVVRGHLRRAVRTLPVPAGAPWRAFRIERFGAIPAAWDSSTPPAAPTVIDAAAVHFFADINGDGNLEWIWIWVDPSPVVPAALDQDPQGDLSPRHPHLKIAAFQRYPPPPLHNTWATYGSPFFTMINNDRQRYDILASNLTPQQVMAVGGTTYFLRSGFSLRIPVPGQPGDDLAQITFSGWIDRDQNQLVTHYEPVHFARESVHLSTQRVASPSLRNVAFESAVLATVRDSCFSFNPSLPNVTGGSYLVQR